MSYLYNRIDDITGVTMGIDYAHHEIHSGSHYYVSGHLTLAEDASVNIKVVTPNTTKWAHFIYYLSSTGLTETTFYEGATGGMTGGTPVTPLNNNRNSIKTSGLTFTFDVTTATDLGLTIENSKWGAEGFKESIGGGAGRDDELMLKQNTIYLRNITSRSADNIIQFKASWYEHTNK